MPRLNWTQRPSFAGVQLHGAVVNGRTYMIAKDEHGYTASTKPAGGAIEFLGDTLERPIASLIAARAMCQDHFDKITRRMN